MYGKIFATMYDGSIYGKWQAIVTFQQMIALADKDGVVDMTAQALSARTSIPLEIIEKGIADLEAPDKVSRTPDEDGRRIVLLDEHRPWGWRITNYQKYREIRTAEERREYHRQYWHKRKDKLNNTQQTQPIVEAEVKAEVKEKKRGRFTPPSLQEVEQYCQERGNSVDPETFIDFYTANGWVQSGNKKIKDWKACVRTWEKRETRRPEGQRPVGKFDGSDAKPGESWDAYQIRKSREAAR